MISPVVYEVKPVPPLVVAKVPVVPVPSGRLVASDRSNAGVASEPPKDS